MPILKHILKNVSLITSSGNMEVVVNDICFDSRKVTKDSLFVAVKGTQVDGHDYIEKAIHDGAVVVIAQQLPDSLQKGVTYLTVKNSAQCLGVVSSNFYDNPSRKMFLIGITGTNGKTTTVTLLYHLFMKLGYKTGLISTVENKIINEEIPATHTTPDPIQLNQLLHKMVKSGCTHCFMEVSSHAIDQERVAGLEYSGAIFTNISHDHLDYHKTFDAYIAVKKKLFDGLNSDAFALINKDDKRGTIMLQNTKANKHTYAFKSIADFKGKIISNSLEGLEIQIDNKEAWFRLIGEFNGYNLLAAYSCGILLGEEPENVLAQLTLLSAASGRFEQISNNANIIAIVDYAHTPDALKNVLTTINNFRTGNEQLITVVGCGGNRDKEKRPLMASIATSLSNKVVLTSDNPRDEDPDEIINEMKQGVSPSDYRKTIVLSDREEAIKTACLLAQERDIILVAGKGHETYQEIRGVKHHFDDREVLGRMLNLIS
ncbi:MAG: UDP-N-acetylmuramoyl-L-alanyl-D-glutamate--2,6-diaminopimelate ligase [Cyclobacteriaceae bacterium]|nr:UDP-N-acetylmuramoyl-L-alanyl-D-glutamate--2,6-diaminopimelate ligase [Cyclobacteriaceae bacterium]